MKKIWLNIAVLVALIVASFLTGYLVKDLVLILQ